MPLLDLVDLDTQRFGHLAEQKLNGVGDSADINRQVKNESSQLHTAAPLMAKQDAAGLPSKALRTNPANHNQASPVRPSKNGTGEILPGVDQQIRSPVDLLF